MTDLNPRNCAEEASRGMNAILRSGWFCLLPPSAIHLVSQVASAHAEDVVSDLDTLAQTLHNLDLDSQLEWGEHGIDPETGVVDLELQQLNQQHRNDLAAGVTALRLPMPNTMREVAELLVRFGVFTRTIGPDGEQWRFADPIPLPEQVLTVRSEWLEQAQRMRSSAEI